MTTHQDDLHRAWNAVREQLTRLTASVDGAPDGHVDLMRFADGYLALAKAYLIALTLQGKTSMRVESVVRALDLKTPKSALERFLGRRDEPPVN
jgi:hypothetical protein